MKKLSLMLFCTLFLFSCEKEKQLIVENNDIPLLSKVTVDGISSYEYTYNDANLLIEEKSKFTYIKHNYSENNLLISSEFYVDPGMFSSSWAVVEASMNRKEWVNPDNTENSLTHRFAYSENGQLAKISYLRLSILNNEYSDISIENDRITRQTLYWNNETAFYIDFEYDEKGNLIKESKFHLAGNGTPELWVTTEYEFDNMHNPFKAFRRLLLPGKFTNTNNITKQTYTIYFEVDQWTDNVHITTNTYEYNDKGYPVKINGESEYVYK